MKGSRRTIGRRYRRQAGRLWVRERGFVLALLVVVGPGVLAGLSDDDPAGITTYSILGADFGYKLLWTLLLSTVALPVSGRPHRTRVPERSAARYARCALTPSTAHGPSCRLTSMPGSADRLMVIVWPL